MWVHRASGAVAIFLAFLYANPAAAGCKDPAAAGVNWQGCNMQMVMLDRVDLSGANLEAAFLSGTAFAGAILREADLQRAELVRTTFEGADLSGANLEKALAARVTAGPKDDAERIRRAFQLVYGRPASAREVHLGVAFVKTTGGNGLTPWERYAQVLLSANEFAFVD